MPIHRLFDQKWRYRPLHETAMYDAIREALHDEGCRNAPDELSAIFRAMRGGTPTQPRAAQLRLPDVWILEGRRRKTLIIVETKRRARHRPGSDYDPETLPSAPIVIASVRREEALFCPRLLRETSISSQCFVDIEGAGHT